MSEEDADGDPAGCDFCRMPLPESPVAATVDGEDYVFCSESCRDAMADADYVFTQYHGHRRVRAEVSAFDSSLPQGSPRNAFVLVSGEPGTRDRAVGAELIWRTLQRGEPAVVVSFQEPPGSVVQQFLTLEWNVLPYLDRGQLHILDCFTYRVADRDRMLDRMDEWNQHLHAVTKDATTTVRDPTDLGEVSNKLDNTLEDRGMVDDGLVLIDSLTELGTLVQPVRAYDFVKDLRADVCKGRFVPVFAGATRHAGDVDQFPHDLSYVVDGLVELRLNEEIVADTLIKQVRIRKLNGVLVIPEWHAYEYTSQLGMVLFDPAEEMEKSESNGESADAEAGSDAQAGAESEDEGGTDAESEDATESEGAPGGDGVAGDGTATAEDGDPSVPEE
jgi:KaiC/GvpD/RAD55 family RecA-like ATPase/YHS domain-containing protein